MASLVFTTPPSRRKAPCHLPLHRGGFARGNAGLHPRWALPPRAPLRLRKLCATACPSRTHSLLLEEKVASFACRMRCFLASRTMAISFCTRSTSIMAERLRFPPALPVMPRASDARPKPSPQGEGLKKHRLPTGRRCFYVLCAQFAFTLFAYNLLLHSRAICFRARFYFFFAASAACLARYFASSGLPRQSFSATGVQQAA